MFTTTSPVPWYVQCNIPVAGKVTPSRAETGLLSDTQKWIVWGDTCANKARDFIGKWHLGGEQEGKGTQENSAAWLTVLGFMVMGLVSRWSLPNHSNSVFPGGSRIAQPRWMLSRGILGSERMSPIDLSRTLPVGGDLFRVPYQDLLS